MNLMVPMTPMTPTTSRSAEPRGKAPCKRRCKEKWGCPFGPTFHWWALLAASPARRASIAHHGRLVGGVGVCTTGDSGHG